MSPLCPLLGASLAAWMLVLAASAGPARAEPPQPLPGFAPDTAVETKESEPEATATESAPADSAATEADDPAESADSPADEAAPPAADSATPTAKADDAAAEPKQSSTAPKNPPDGPRRPSVAREKATRNGKYTLAYKFKPGEVIRWEVVHRAVVDTTIQGTNQTAETRSTSIKAWQVTDVSPEGNITLVHSVESIDMWQKMQGRQEVSYNSRTDDKVPPGYEDIAKAVAVPLTVVTIDPQGGVLKREEKHRQSNASNMPLAVPLPANPVAVGDTWSVPCDVDVILHGGGTKKIETRQKFVLEKVAGGLATIAVETQVLTPISDPAIEAQLVQRFTNGTLRFDLEQGRVVSQQLDLDRKVVGFSGTSSSMHYLTRFTEELLTDNSPVAYRKPPTKAPAAMTTKPAAPAAPPATAKAPPKPRARPAQR